MNVHRNSYRHMRRLVGPAVETLSARLDEDVLVDVRKAADADEWGDAVSGLIDILVEGPVAVSGPEYRAVREAARWVRVEAYMLRDLPLHSIGRISAQRVAELAEAIQTLYGRRTVGEIAAVAPPRLDTVTVVTMVEQVIASLALSGTEVMGRDYWRLADLAEALGIDPALVNRMKGIHAPRPSDMDSF